MGTENADHDDASACDFNVDHEGVVGDLGIVGSTMLTRMDLGLAYFSEKVTNLSILVMHLATMESELEALISEKGHGGLLCSSEKVLDFDLLSGVLDSEVRELDGFLDTVEAGIASAREILSSCTHSGEVFTAIRDKLLESEQYWKQSEEQFAEIKMQSATFQRTLSSFKRAENGDSEADEIINGDDNKSLNVNAEIKMRTIEQQRHILVMLEKSLARAMDLEKNLDDSIEIREKMKLKMLPLEQELVCMEEEATTVWERLFEADNSCEILLGISQSLLGRLQVSQFNLNGSSLRESELRAKLENFGGQSESRDLTSDNIGTSTTDQNSFLLGQTNDAKANLKDAEDKLILANSKVFSLSEKVSSLEKQLEESEIQLQNAMTSADEYQKHYNVLCSETRDMGNLIVDLKENVSIAESQANSAEAQCKLLTETNSKLNEEITLLKDSSGTSERVDLLDRQLKESNLLLRNAAASAEASQEKQKMLYLTIRDMENVIKDLKSKVSKAESRADSAEENCIILSETNADLNEELSFLRSRLECLERSLHRAEEAKMASAKDIGNQAKLFKNLVTQLTVERERLMQQLSSLESENKNLVVKLKQTHKGHS